MLVLWWNIERKYFNEHVNLSFAKGGDILAQEAINKIQEAEAVAAKTVSDAMEESKKIINSAQSKAVEEFNSIISLANKNAKLMKDEAQRQGEEEAKPSLTKGDKDVEVILNTSKEKIDSAVSLVIGRIVKFNGNS